MTGQDLYLALMAELSEAHAVLHDPPLSVTAWKNLPADKQADYNGRADGANLMGMSLESTAKHIAAASK